MRRLTVSVNEEQYAYLEERADPPDRSKAAVIRELIDAARSGEDFTGVNHSGERALTTAVKSGEDDELLERIEAIETRLAEIAPADVDAAPIGAEHTPDAPGGERDREHSAVESEPPRTTDDTPDSRTPSERDSRPVSDDALRDRMERRLEELDVPGRARAVEYARREAARWAWEYLREEGSARPRDIADATFGAFFEEGSLNYTTSAARFAGYQLWDGYLRETLRELPGVVPEDQTWRFDPAAVEDVGPGSETPG